MAVDPGGRRRDGLAELAREAAAAVAGDGVAGVGGSADVAARRPASRPRIERGGERAEERAERRPRRQAAGDAHDLSPAGLATAPSGSPAVTAMTSAPRASAAFAAASVSAVAPL